MSYGPIFHPNSPTLAQAGVITVAAGDDRSGVDVSLTLVPTRAIEGVVLDPSGQPASQIQLFISGNGTPNPFSFDAAPILTGRSTTLGPGRFRYTNVTAGRYTVTAKRPGPPAFWAKAEVDVERRDVTGLELRLQPALSISGRVVFDGKTLRATGMDVRAGHVVVTDRLRRREGQSDELRSGHVDGGHRRRGRRVARTGSFPATMWPRAFITGNAPATGWWLRSAMISGVDAVDVPATIDGSTTGSIVFTFSDRRS